MVISWAAWFYSHSVDAIVRILSEGGGRRSQPTPPLWVGGMGWVDPFEGVSKTPKIVSQLFFPQQIYKKHMGKP